MRKIFQRQVSSEMLDQFLITEKKKACPRFRHGNPNPTVEEQVAGLRILHERLGGSAPPRPKSSYTHCST